jgi:hypothetical protein
MIARMTAENGYGRMPARFVIECDGLATEALWQGQAHYPRNNKAAVMGGDMTVTSEPGKGSVFTVRLPGGAIA